MAEEFESYNSVTLTDENGRDIEFELVDAIEHGGRKYCVLFPAEMPAGERGNSEPVILEYIADENGAVKQAVLQVMKLGEPDASGRRRPEPIEGQTVTMDVDSVIVAVGVSPNPLVPNSIKGLKLGRKNTIVVNDAMQSSRPEIYAGGDIVRGGATVILAMGDGRRAAANMDQQLRGDA